MQPIPASRVIYAIIPAGTAKGARVLFPIDKFLLNRPIVAIETYNGSQLVTAPSGLPVVTSGDAQKVTITLVRQSAEIHHDIPDQLLNTINLFGLYKTMPPTVIDWNASYIKVTDTLQVTGVFVVPLVIHYVPDRNE